MLSSVRIKLVVLSCHISANFNGHQTFNTSLLWRMVVLVKVKNSISNLNQYRNFYSTEKVLSKLIEWLILTYFEVCSSTHI